MKRSHLLFGVGLCMLQSAGGAFAQTDCAAEPVSVCQLDETSPSLALALTDEQIERLGIALGRATRADAVPSVTASARVVVPPDRERIVSNAVSGLLTRLHVAEGDVVKQGQAVAQLNSPELLAWQRDYLKQASELQLAEAVYRRDRTLQQEGVIPQSRWEETRSRYQVAKSHSDEAGQLLSIAGMSEAEMTALQKSRRLQSQLDLLAPISGTVLARLASAGERLAANSPVYRIADLSRLWLELAVPQNQIDRIAIGDRVQVVDSESVAEVSLISQQVEQGTQTVSIRAVLSSARHGLRPGQTIDARVFKAADRPLFNVPQSALVQSEGSDYLFVRNAQGFSILAIEVVGRQDDRVFVAGDLRGDEAIALRGTAALKAQWLGAGSEE